MILPIALYSIQLFANLPQFDRSKNHLPFQLAWGPYIVRVEQVSTNKSDTAQKVRILNKRGKLIKEIQSRFINKVETVELTGEAPKDLHILSWSGGAYCCLTDLYFTMDNRLQNILIFRGEDLGIQSIINVHNDNRPIIVVNNPALGDFSANNFHRHYPLVTVLRWKRNRFVDVTRYYPENSLIQANLLKKKVWDDIHKQSQYYHEWEVQDEIAAYYANMLAVRQKDKAQKWIRDYLPKRLRRWLHSHGKELQIIVSTAARRRASVNQSNHIKIN